MIGEVLRSARKSKRFTMSQVADMVGVTTGYISNLENNRLEPSLTLLRDLAEKLGVPPSVLIAEERVEYITHIRPADRPRLQFHNLPCSCEVLTPLSWHGTDNAEIEAVQITAPSGMDISMDHVSGDTDMCLYVLSGEVTYHYGDSTLKIEQNGSLFIPRSMINHIENTGAQDAIMIYMTRSLSADRQADAAPVQKEKAVSKQPAAGSQLLLLGKRIRDLRRSNGLAVKTFAKAVGVTPAYISQIERNLTEPSLRVLRKIAKELNVELTLLFASDMPSDVLVTASGERNMMHIADSNMLLQLLVPYQTADGRSPDMSVVLAELSAGQADTKEGIEHDYDELCIVLEGTIEYQTTEGTYTLVQGDSLYIRKGIHHSIINNSDRQAKILVVLGSVFHRRINKS